MYSILFLASLLTAEIAALAVPSSVSSVLHEKRGRLDPRFHWKKTFASPQDATIPVRIGLMQQNLDKGYEHLLSVSDPDSPSYGKFWTPGQVEAEFAPPPSTAKIVQDWLGSFGISDAAPTPDRAWIAFNATVEKVQRLLQTEILEYEDPQDGSTRLGCDHYSLPAHVAPHVDYITPAIKLSPPVKKSLVARAGKRPAHKPPTGPAIYAAFNGSRFAIPADAKSLPSNVQNCSVSITPPCIRALYNIPNSPNAVAGNGLGVFEEGDTYAQEDLNSYFTKYAPNVPNGTHPFLISVNGAKAPTSLNNAGAESAADFSLAYALLGPANVTLYQTQDPLGFNGDFASIVDPFLDAVDGSFCTKDEKSAGFQCGGASLTQVVSFSYVTAELFFQSAAVQHRVCNEFMKLSLQGHTFVFSSGDYGVASNPLLGGTSFRNNGCIPSDLDNSGQGTLAYDGPIFSPGFPANCPYVLSVGATQVDADKTVNDVESAMNLPGIGESQSDAAVTFATGGGFSNYFPMPDYQAKAVAQFFATNDPGYPTYKSNGVDVADTNRTNIGKNGGLYNRAGRGIPDVAANGANLQVFTGGVQISQAGTSLATPIWAAIIAIINKRRAGYGKGPVGFVNPTLYKHPEVFNDVTVGFNSGCGTNGFEAGKGWDPLTGLGTPKFASLSSLFMSLP